LNRKLLEDLLEQMYPSTHINLFPDVVQLPLDPEDSLIPKVRAQVQGILLLLLLLLLT
jgi:hypothetical protein